MRKVIFVNARVSRSFWETVCCLECGKSFLTKAQNKKLFCSGRCADAYWAKKWGLRKL
jgi:hypothetical protein